MPRTPAAVRPIGRTSFSSKRIALPPLEHRMICRWPSVMSTPTSRSPASSSMAMMPAWRGRENASSEVFLTVPCAVAMNTNLFSSNSWIGSTAVDALALLQRQQVDDRLAARAAARLRQLVHLEPVHLADAGEAQQRVVRVRDEQLVDEILVLHRGRGLAATAAPLRLIRRHRLRLRIAAVRQRHHDVLLLDQVFDRQVRMILDDLGATLVGVLRADVFQLGTNHREQPLGTRQDVAEIAGSAPAAPGTRRRSCPAPAPVRRFRRRSRIAWACASDSR